MELSFGPDRADAEQRSREQAARLLAAYQKALGHELPNQLVALQGLAQILAAEFSEHMDDEARRHLDRLVALTRHADECVRVLAQVGRWYRDREPRTPVRVAELAEEAVAEVNLLSP